jgi:hypothetical protein
MQPGVENILFATPDQEEAEMYAGTVVPLYRSPPQPRWWLTEDERELLTLEGNRHARHVEPNINCGAVDSARYHASAVRMFDAILARSTPPEVVLPQKWGYVGRDVVVVKSEVIAALAAAGVAVKEAT